MAVGYKAGENVSTGSNNIFLGKETGRYAGTPGGNITTDDNRIVLGNNNITHLNCKVSTITTPSDARDKADVTNFTGGLSWINAMRPVTYKWDERVDYVDKEGWDGSAEALLAVTPDGTHKKDPLQIGLLAQEVLEVEKANGYGSNNDTSLLVDVLADTSAYSLQYGHLVPILISAIKELSAKVEALENG